MKSVSRFACRSAGLCATVILLAGCATEPKRMTPSGEAPKGQFLKGMDVVEQPALEPDWSDYVKDHYPNWRAHYWVDRGQWGNRGYIFGKPPAAAETPVEAQMTPLPPAPPAPPAAPTIVESEPPRIEAPARPTSYTVKKGDSLWRISGKIYHNPLKWYRIYKANKTKIKNPNRIYPGQVLRIPQD